MNPISGLVTTRILTFAVGRGARPETVFLAFPSLVSEEHVAFRTPVRNGGPDFVAIPDDCRVQ